MTRPRFLSLAVFAVFCFLSIGSKLNAEYCDSLYSGEINLCYNDYEYGSDEFYTCADMAYSDYVDCLGASAPGGCPPGFICGASLQSPSLLHPSKREDTLIARATLALRRKGAQEIVMPLHVQTNRLG